MVAARLVLHDPSVDALAEHFAKKLSLGGEENDAVPIFQPVVRSKLRSFRVSSRRVKRVLKSLNANKSSNGISNRFLKECHTVLVAPITSLFQRIANDATWPKRWKTGRVTAL